MEQEPIQKSEEFKSNKPKMLILLVLIVAILFGVVAIITVMENRELHAELNTLNSSINTTQIFNQGIVASVAELVKTTNDCQIVLVQYQNTSRQLVDVQCVRDLLKAQNITGG